MGSSRRAPEALTGGWLDLGAAVLALGVHPFVAIRYGFLSDDAFICFRYARNLVEGHGLVFNLGERVEGYTNLLYVLLVAGLHALGTDPVIAGRSIGLMASSALVLLAYRVAARLAGGKPYGLLASALLALNPYLSIWSLGGLETPLFALGVLASTSCVLFGGPRPGPVLAASGLAAALTLTRPEGALLYVVLVSFAFATSAGSPGRRLVGALPGLLLFAGIVTGAVLWRRGYYGDWLPNTFYAKSAFTLAHVERGTRYLAGFAKVYAVLPMAALAFWGAATRRTRDHVLLLLIGLALIIEVVLVGGDGLPGYRFMVPLLGPLAVLASSGTREALKSLRRLAPNPELLVALAAVALVALSSWPARDDQLELYIRQTSYEIPAWTEVGQWLRTNVPADTTISCVPIGAVSYHSRLRTVDILGLTDRRIARVRKGSLGTGWPGHEKTAGAYVLSLRPDLLLLGNIYVSAANVVETKHFAPFSNPWIYERERDIVENPLFARDYQLASVRLDSGRYLNCFARREFRSRVAPSSAQAPELVPRGAPE